MDEFLKRLRAMLSEDGVEAFDDIVLMRKLGTVNNIRSIGRIYSDLAANAVEFKIPSSAVLIERAIEFTDFFASTRGKHSCSIITAMRIMTSGLTALSDHPLAETQAFLQNAYPAYEALSSAWLMKIKAYLSNLAAECGKVLLFDYSSTVSILLEAAAALGKQLEVYIPCSGVLYGGRQFILDAVKYGHKPYVVQDVAMFEFIRKADAAFTGAESIYPDGSAANSVGSDIVSVLCGVCKTPLYVVSTLLKYNPATVRGDFKRCGYWDLRERMPIDLPQEVRSAADFTSKNLVLIEWENVTAFVTEMGVIPPNEMFYTGDRYLRNWKEQKDEPII